MSETPGDGSAKPAAVPTPAQAALREAYKEPPALDLPVKNGKGYPVSAEANVLHIFEHDPRWQGVIAFDAFAQRPVKLKAPPYNVGEAGPWSNQDDSETIIWLQTKYNVRFLRPHVTDAVSAASWRHKFNDLQRWLAGLEWDGKRRLRKWLVSYLGADDGIPDDVAEDPPALERQLRYLELVGVKTLVGAVARAFEPGCKLDTMTVLEGPQGAMKSTVWRTLGQPWFTDSYVDAHQKDAMAIILGMWFVEWSELDALNRSEIAAIKRFMSTPSDRYRTWYGTRAEDVPRTCLFVGSVNDSTYLRDTENRRFWPVHVGRIDIQSLARDRDQLFAEAVRWYRHRVRWWVTPGERDIFAEQQERRYDFDAFEEKIRGWLYGGDGHGVRPDVMISEVLEEALGLRPDHWTKDNKRRAQNVLGRLGWKRKQIRQVGSWQTREWRYFPPEAKGGER